MEPLISNFKDYVSPSYAHMMESVMQYGGLTRREVVNALVPPHQDKVVCIERITELYHIIEMLGMGLTVEETKQWLTTAKTAFNERSPLDAIKYGRFTDVVLELDTNPPEQLGMM